MSHFVRIRTQLREREHLTAALRDMHHQYRDGQNLEVRGWRGNAERAEIVVDTGSRYDIGFKQQGQEYEVVADWWGVEGNTAIRQQTFLQDINRRYARSVVLEQAKEQYLIVEHEETLENGDTVILLTERG